MDHGDDPTRAIKEEATALIAKLGEYGVAITKEEHGIVSSVDLEFVTQVYKLYAKVMEQVDDYRKHRVTTFDAASAFSQITAWNMEAFTLPEQCKKFTSCKNLMDFLDEYERCMKLVDTVSSVGITNSQIALLMEAANGPPGLCMETFTVGMFLDLNPLSLRREIQHIIEGSASQDVMQEEHTAIRTHWEKRPLQHVTHQGHVILATKDNRQVLVDLKESLQTLERLIGKRFSSFFRDQLYLLKSDFEATYAVINEVLNVQELWIKLWPAMETTRVAKRIDRDQQYPTMSSMLHDLLNDVVKQCVSVADLRIHVDRINAVLTSVRPTFESLYKEFMLLVDEKCWACPRLYFLTLEDCVELILSTKPKELVTKHLPKLFAGIHELKYAAGSVVGATTQSGERISFAKPCPIANSGDEWITALHNALQYVSFPIPLLAREYVLSLFHFE